VRSIRVATPAKSVTEVPSACAVPPAAYESELLESLARKLPRYPVPVALIGRLAVDLEFQRKGVGALLLADACRKVVQASAVLAVAGVVVDAKDAPAVRFYAHFGFVTMPGQANRMLLPAKVLAGL